MTCAARRDDDGLRFAVLQLKGRRAEDRFLDLLQRKKELGEVITHLCNGDTDSTFVYIERPMVGRNIRASLDQMAVVGALRSILHDLGVPTTTVDPGTWKKAVVGNGRAAKETIREWGMRIAGMRGDYEQDFYDAAAIASWAWQSAR